MKPIHKFIYFLMNVGALAIFIPPIMLVKYFELSDKWTWVVLFFSTFYYACITGGGSAISMYRARKEIEFIVEQNKLKTPYF